MNNSSLDDASSIESSSELSNMEHELNKDEMDGLKPKSRIHHPQDKEDVVMNNIALCSNMRTLEVTAEEENDDNSTDGTEIDSLIDKSEVNLVDVDKSKLSYALSHTNENVLIIM